MSRNKHATLLIVIIIIVIIIIIITLLIFSKRVFSLIYDVKYHGSIPNLKLFNNWQPLTVTA